MTRKTKLQELITTLSELSGMSEREVRAGLVEIGGLIDIDMTGQRTPVITLSKEAKRHAERIIESAPLD